MVDRTLYVLLGLFLYTISFGQEVPKIIHFTTEDYQAQNQNWDIDQSADYQMYFGNSAGLLTYDGSRWRTLQTPFNQIVRTVYDDGKGRVYVGGFATLGYWHINAQHEEEYVSLTDLIFEDQIASEEIWHVLPLEDGLLFQSFSTFFKYDFETIEVIKAPGNIMFCRQVDGKLIVPVIGGELFEYRSDGSYELVAGSEILSGKRIATILAKENNSWIVGTQNEGLFLFENGRFSSWEVPVNAYLKSLQLNNGLRLANGNYVFGTILGGLFITDANGNILHQINQENGLQNNTVLSLYEDRMNMLWVGLDKGIDLVEVSSPLLFYQDKSGHIGTVYTAVEQKGKLYVGTNQGVFQRDFSENSQPFQLIAGSQGQVWDLKLVDGQILGSHNVGVFQIENGKLEFLDNRAGTFRIIEHPSHKDVLLQGAYIGINVLQKNAAGKWQFSHRLEGYTAPVRKLFFDEEGKIWTLHPRKGLARLTIDDELQNVTDVEDFGEVQGLASEFGLDIEKIGKEIFVDNGGDLLRWDAPKNHLEKVQDNGEYMRVQGEAGEEFLLFPDKIIRKTKEESHAYPITLRQSNRCVIPVSDEFYFLCVEEGYALLPRLQVTSEKEYPMPKPIITQIAVNENGTGQRNLRGVGDSLVFRSTERNLRFYFTQPLFTSNVMLRSKLIGFDNQWTAFSKNFNREFTNLNTGSYQFQVQAENSSEMATLSFVIEPRWYQTLWARMGAVLLGVFVLWLFYRLHNARLQRHLAKLEAEKAKELNRQQTESENRMLQNEVLNKSRKLADTTINLVRKNETLMKINEELIGAKKEKDSVKLSKKLQQLNRLVEGHIANEEDWQIFEETFNQLHDQFFKRLKEKFPELTPGDFRLAAYLKMNLSSKEIAPLLNISLRGVENKRYRLRRKLGLPAEDNLVEFFMQF